MNATQYRRVRWAFPPILAATTEARRRLAGQLRAWGIPGRGAEPVVLVAHELVTNAVEHARTPLELSVSFDGAQVVVEVHDQSPLEPRLQPFNPSATRGRGLQIVAALATSWNYVRHTCGKTIRAVILAGPGMVAVLA
jgi:anti-sigma regulatory factor (Ser/Thr protein kinase)